MDENTLPELIKNYQFRFENLGAKIEAAWLKNGIHAYWWNFTPNAGDLVTPILLRHYGFTPIHTWKNTAQVLSCGSILQNLPEDFSGYILGSGLLNIELAAQLKHARILAVRGKLTRDAIGAPIDAILGDPGLLVTEVYRNRQRKQFPVGLIPHYKEKTHPTIQKLCRMYPDDVHFIDIQGSVLKVLSEIDKCDFVMSSSLHGLTFADALEIPCGWILLDHYASESKKFKYLDYNSALNREQVPIHLQGTEQLSQLVKKTSKPSKGILEQVKGNLDGAFRQLAKEILHK